MMNSCFNYVRPSVFLVVGFIGMCAHSSSVSAGEAGSPPMKLRRVVSVESPMYRLHYELVVLASYEAVEVQLKFENPNSFPLHLWAPYDLEVSLAEQTLNVRVGRGVRPESGLPKLFSVDPGSSISLRLRGEWQGSLEAVDVIAVFFWYVVDTDSCLVELSSDVSSEGDYWVSEIDSRFSVYYRRRFVTERAVFLRIPYTRW